MSRIVIARDQKVERIVFKGARMPMTRRELQAALEPVFRAWIRAACSWDAPVLGDHRFLVFSLEVAPGTQVYVQFWSEPLDPVIWEVSSGRWNPPADEWITGERARRIEAMGFEIGGEAENYHRLVEVNTAADIAAAAKAVVRIFLSGFDYRGTAPILAQLAHEGRSQAKPTYDTFGPDDVSKVFARFGFQVEEPEGGEDAAPVIRCRKRGVSTLVEFCQEVPDEDLYRSIRLSADVPLPPDERERLLAGPDAPEGAEPFAEVSVVHRFGGGVTLDWLIERVQEWEAALALRHREARRRPRVAAPALGETVH